MTGWMDDWMDGRLDGWTDDWMVGRTTGWTDDWMDGRLGGWTTGWMDDWVDGRLDGWTTGWTDDWVMRAGRTTTKKHRPRDTPFYYILLEYLLSIIYPWRVDLFVRSQCPFR